MPKMSASEGFATTLWTAVAEEGALDELNLLVGDISDEEFEKLAHEAHVEVELELATRLRPYETKVSRATLDRILD